MVRTGDGARIHGLLRSAQLASSTSTNSSACSSDILTGARILLGCAAEGVIGGGREIDRLVGAVDRRGYTVVPTAMYWSRGKAKVEIGMARGKRQHDKRKTEKDRDWERQKGRIMKRG